MKKVGLPTGNGGDSANVGWQLWWQAPYLYVASANDGVYIVDASDPANAVIANRGAGKPNPVPTGELGGFRVGPIFTMGNHMVLSSMDNTDGFASLDISDPLNPKPSEAPTRSRATSANCSTSTRRSAWLATLSALSSDTSSTSARTSTRITSSLTAAASSLDLVCEV